MADHVSFSNPTIVHLSGIPGSGKTTYARWLAREKGFRHLESDKLLTGQGPEEDITLIRKLVRPVEFKAAIEKLGQPTVLDWGFRPYFDFNLVCALQQVGVISWWFNADRDAARTSFKRRGDVSMEDFEIQIKSIESRWPEMRSEFGPRIIESLDRNGSFLQPAAIFAQMFAG